MAEVASTHQGKEIRRGGNEAICNSKALSRETTNKGVEEQDHTRDGAQAVHYPVNAQKSNGSSNAGLPN